MYEDVMWNLLIYSYYLIYYPQPYQNSQIGPKQWNEWGIIKIQIINNYNSLTEPTSMGNLSSQNPLANVEGTSEAEFMKQLCYIESRTIPHIGPIQIYRFKEAPYDYIMRHRRVFSMDDPALGVYVRNLEIVTGELAHKNIAQIHCYKNNTQFHMCGKSAQIETYCNYYAITLQEIITKRRKDDIRFTPNEIWYVLRSLLEVSVTLRSKNYNFGAYKSKNITLSSQGYIKLYILHLNKQSSTPEEQTYNEYTIAFNDRSNIAAHLPVPPEYIPSLREGNLAFPFQPSKEDSFMIATVILEMMSDEDVRKYYSLSSDNFCVYKRSSVWKDLGVLGYVYDKKYLLALLEKMLEDDPNKRISPEDALKFICDNRDHINVGGSLRMFEDEQNHIKPKISYRTSFDFESNILKTVEVNVLEYKLTACPIKTLSKKNNNKSIGVSLTSSKKSTETKDKSLNKSRVLQFQSSRGSSLSTKVGIPH